MPFLLPILLFAAAANPYDIVIRNGRIIDGTGSPWYAGDIGIQPAWRTFGEYFARLRKQGMGINLASYVGATQVRRVVVGEDNRAPTAAELERMKALVRDAMREGAVGLSTSLQYAPAPYATTEELIALAAEAGKFGGVYASHIRDEGNGIIGALDEAFRIGREAKIPVELDR